MLDVAMLIRGIFLLALALLAGCATAPGGPQDFAGLQREFLARYASLKVPDLGLSYAANLEAIGSAESLAERARFFGEWRARWSAVRRSDLARDDRRRYDTLVFETGFNAERTRLESRYVQARPASTPAGGLSRLPDAHDWYALYLQRNASRDTTPEALFAFSEAEVARIRGEMRRIQERQGYAGRDGEWRERLRSQVVTNPEAVAREFERMRDAVQAALPKYFAAAVRPPAIKPVPDPTKDTPPGYYQDGTFFFSFFGNRFPARSFGWLYLHEAVPGHHYQLTLHPMGSGRFWYPAYVEGWGAYCENLGAELGVYANPDLEYGKWEWDLVRSARVALDVGIHHKGWSREQSLAYWRANVPDQEDIAVREIDRITRWPAQVVSYKVGERAFLDLKAEHARRQGASFDVRDFHARVLALGAVPISVLERALREPPG
jgi:uncharacterized protein (DUF885 family)